MESYFKSVHWFSRYNHRNKLTNWVIIFWNFTNMLYCFWFYVIKSADRPSKMYCYQSYKKHCLQKQISLKLGHWAWNARKYVRCARTFSVAMLLNQQIDRQNCIVSSLDLSQIMSIIELLAWESVCGVPVTSIYFSVTLGVKEVLQSSKNSTSIFFMVFDSISLPHSKKFLENLNF